MVHEHEKKNGAGRANDEVRAEDLRDWVIVQAGSDTILGRPEELDGGGLALEPAYGHGLQRVQPTRENPQGGIHRVILPLLFFTGVRRVEVRGSYALYPLRDCSAPELDQLATAVNGAETQRSEARSRQSGLVLTPDLQGLPPFPGGPRRG